MPTFALMARHRGVRANQSGRGRMLANVFSNTTSTRTREAADVPLVGLALSLLFMAAIVVLAFIACAGLQ
jgi:hypothetical protein